MNRFYSYLKILVYFLMFVTALQILFLAVDIVTPLLSLIGFDYSNETISNNQLIISIIKLILMSYFIYILIGVGRMGYKAKEKSLFTIENVKGLKKYAKAMILYAVCVLCLRFFENWFDADILEKIDGSPLYKTGYMLGYTFGEALRSQMPIILLALFFFMLAELANDGYQLKQENDLTI